MGARNVTAAFVRWSGPLADQDRPFRVLLYMAQVSQDDGGQGQEPRRWFGGWEPLAEVALGRRLPPEPLKVDGSPEAVTARRARAAADRAVRLAIAALVQVGALTRVRHGGRGLRAEYRLNLDPFPFQAEAHPPAKAEAHPPAKAEAHPPAKAEAHPPPEEQQRSNRGEREEQHHLIGTGHLGDRSPTGEVPMSLASAAARAALAQATGKAVAVAERPPWCGQCSKATRMRYSEPPDGGVVLGRCPTCHPAVVTS